MCVDPRDGTEARHTRTANSRLKPDCGRCHQELAGLVAKKATWFPSCNAKNGRSAFNTIDSLTFVINICYIGIMIGK